LQNSKIRVDLFSKKIKMFKLKKEADMADYKFDGKEFRDRRGSRIGEIDGKYFRDSHGKRVGEFDGKDIRDSHGSRISNLDDVKKIIDGIGGASLVAMWLFFVR